MAYILYREHPYLQIIGKELRRNRYKIDTTQVAGCRFHQRRKKLHYARVFN